jgi:hypothetical protein
MKRQHEDAEEELVYCPPSPRCRCETKPAAPAASVDMMDVDLTDIHALSNSALSNSVAFTDIVLTDFSDFWDQGFQEYMHARMLVESASTKP